MIDPATPDYENTPVNGRRPKYHYNLAFSEVITPQVSVVTPFYNPGPIFEETIQALKRQSFQNFEWIIVDDGTDDPESLKLLNQIACSDHRIQIIKQSNRGPSVARNRAVEVAKSDYIFQIDADDLVEPTFIEKCIWFLESHPEYGFCNSYSIGFDEKNYLWSKGFNLGRFFLKENFVPPPAIIRRQVYRDANGYDESIRWGHEDWDFWLNLAAHGYWGYTIPEYLVWYRRRSGTRISETQELPEKEKNFREFLNQKYFPLLGNGFPDSRLEPDRPCATVKADYPFHNPVQKPEGFRRILLLLPWLVMGGADKFNLDLVSQLSENCFEITICTTLPSENPWLAEFARFTPDIFNLPNFLKLADYPRFLVYLLNSRQIDTVLISNSQVGYLLLPFLRAHCPHVTFLDYNHMEEENWKNGGYPRSAVGYQSQLDLNLVSTHHLKNWMTMKGAEADRVEVCYTNIDPQKWQSHNAVPAPERNNLGIPEEIPLLLYAGRIVEQKRPQLFAEVMRKLVHENQLSFVCLVAGEGSDLPFLKKFVRQHHLDSHVQFLGAVSTDRMKALHGTADIFFLPSKMEGLSLALFEAMAMETVPVSAAVGGQSELVTPDCGFLIPHGEHEIDEYVRVLKHLIQHPDQRRQMAKAGRLRIEQNFRLDQMTSHIIKLFDDAQYLAKTKPRQRVWPELGLELATQAVELTRLEQRAEQMWHERYQNSVSVQDLSGEHLGRTARTSRLVQALLFNLANQPGLGWLYTFRNLGKRVLGGE